MLQKDGSLYEPPKAEAQPAPVAEPEPVIEPEPQPEEAPKPRFTVAKPQKPDYVFTAQQLAVDDELKFLVGEAQTALGKVLSNADVSTLLMLKDTCGLPLDVILMLIQYAISIDTGKMPFNSRVYDGHPAGATGFGVKTLYFYARQAFSASGIR